jgi:hypothetical protein
MPRPAWLFDDSPIPDPSGRGAAAVRFLNSNRTLGGVLAAVSRRADLPSTGLGRQVVTRSRF